MSGEPFSVLSDLLRALSGSNDVVVEVGRYSSDDIEIRGDELRDIPIAGYFKAGEVDAVVEALHIMTGIEVIEVAPGHLALSAPK